MLLPIILAGGTGERLWPLSRGSKPKQFLCLNDNKLSLLQETVIRVTKLTNALAPLIIGNEEHKFYRKTRCGYCRTYITQRCLPVE